MIKRRIFPALQKRLGEVPAVVLLGPRQAGKTTIALALGKKLGAIYLDLESEQDRTKLAEPEMYLNDHLGKLIILDEIHRAPFVASLPTEGSAKTRRTRRSIHPRYTPPGNRYGLSTGRVAS